MATKSKPKKSIRKLTKEAGGSSYAIIIPRSMVRELGWQEHQKVVVERSRGRIIIRDWKP